MQVPLAGSTAVDDRAHPFPWWANALDLVTVAAALTALMLFVRTGPRFYLGSAFISIQSPWRALAGAGVVALLRHALVSQPALYSRLAAGMLALAGSRSLHAVAIPFAASRGAVLLAAYLALLTIGYPGDRPRPRFSDNEFVNMVAKWDAEWYLTIARDGYRWDEGTRDNARLAFFPAYPMLLRGAAWLVGSPVVGGLILSLTAFLWGLTYVFRLARADLDEPAARAAVALLAFCPFSIFYGALYTESLFLLAAAGSLYHFRQNEWVKASVWGLVIGLTRPNGCLLSVVLLAVLAERLFRAARQGRLAPAEWRRAGVGLLVASMPVAGMAVYAAFCWTLTGDPLVWMRLHGLWGRGDRTIVQMLGDRYAMVRDRGFFGYLAEMPIDFVNLSAGVLAAAGIWPVFRRLGVASAVFVAINVLPPVLSGTPLSLARLASTLFPLFIYLAVALPESRRASVVGAFATLQGFFAVLFFTWRRFY